MIASDRQSIFGDTYGGVPNPQIPFVHPYPTRYHGAIFTTPRFGMPFIAQPMARVPFSGLGAYSGPGMNPALVVASAVVFGTVVGAISGGIASKGGKASPERIGRVAGVSYGIVAGAAALAVGLAFVAGASSSTKG